MFSDVAQFLIFFLFLWKPIIVTPLDGVTLMARRNPMYHQRQHTDRGEIDADWCKFGVLKKAGVTTPDSMHNNFHWYEYLFMSQ